MSAIDKLRHVKESAGEKWHEDSPEHQMCSCGYSYLHGRCEVQNPSPDDLNELYRLAEKLGYGDNVYIFRENGEGLKVFACSVEYLGYAYGGDTRQEALLNALFIATGGQS